MNELEKLTKRIQNRHPRCFINDPLSFPLQIGDYGKIKNGKFERIGNVFLDSNMSIPNPITKDSISNEQITSDHVRTFLVDAEGGELKVGSVEAKAGIGFSFQEEGSIFMECSKSQCAIIPSVKLLGDHIKKLMKSGDLQWENDNVVVVTLHNAYNIYLITAKKKNTCINFMAEVDLSTLSNADIRLSNPALKFRMTIGSQDYTIVTSPQSTYLYEVYEFDKKYLQMNKNFVNKLTLHNTNMLYRRKYDRKNFRRHDVENVKKYDIKMNEVTMLKRVNPLVLIE